MIKAAKACMIVIHSKLQEANFDSKKHCVYILWLILKKSLVEVFIRERGEGQRVFSAGAKLLGSLTYKNISLSI